MISRQSLPHSKVEPKLRNTKYLSLLNHIRFYILEIYPQLGKVGLGYDLNIDNRLIEIATVIHFNGNMKRWLKLAIGRYKPLWERYINQSHPYLQDCVTS
jgi:hypothetical protein